MVGWKGGREGEDGRDGKKIEVASGEKVLGEVQRSLLFVSPFFMITSSSVSVGSREGRREGVRVRERGPFSATWAGIHSSFLVAAYG